MSDLCDPAIATSTNTYRECLSRRSRRHHVTFSYQSYSGGSVPGRCCPGTLPEFFPDRRLRHAACGLWNIIITPMREVTNTRGHRMLRHGGQDFQNMFLSVDTRLVFAETVLVCVWIY